MTVPPDDARGADDEFPMQPLPVHGCFPVVAHQQELPRMTDESDVSTVAACRAALQPYVYPLDGGDPVVLLDDAAALMADREVKLLAALRAINGEAMNDGRVHTNPGQTLDEIADLARAALATVQGTDDAR